MIIKSRTRAGKIKRYHYSHIGNTPVNKYFAEKVKRRRQAERFSRDVPKIRVCEVSAKVAQELRELRLSVRLSYSALGRMYNLTPYIVKHAIANASNHF